MKTNTGELMTTGEIQQETIKFILWEAHENISNLMCRQRQKERGFKLR